MSDMQPRTDEESGGTRFRGASQSRLPWLLVALIVIVVVAAVYFLYFAPR